MNKTNQSLINTQILYIFRQTQMQCMLDMKISLYLVKLNALSFVTF